MKIRYPKFDFMKYLIILIIFLNSLSAFSQAMVCNCNFGIKAGVNFATITEASNASNRIGFTAGFFGGARLSNAIGIQGELLYSKQGADIGSEDLALGYLNVPVVLKYFVAGGFNIQAGPQFGFLMDNNVESILSEMTNVESFDFSGFAGLGYDATKRLKIDARYNFGITDVFDNQNGKNSVISLSVGYSFL